MTALIGLCQKAIRRFSGFPAVSLPRRRFDERVERKSLAGNDFSMHGALRKFFFPELP
jgi:hypothetical protein